MKVYKTTGMSQGWSLGNYERQVYLELDQELTNEQCQRVVASTPAVRNLIDLHYDSMLSTVLCKLEIKKLLHEE